MKYFAQRFSVFSSNRALVSMANLEFDKLKMGGRSGPGALTAILFQTEASFIAKKCDLSFPETKELGSLLVRLCEKGRPGGDIENGRTRAT